MIQSIIFILIILTALFLRSKLRETAFAKLSPVKQSLVAVLLLILLLLAFAGKLGLLIPLFGAVTAAFVALLSRLMPILGPLISQHLPHWLETHGFGKTPSEGSFGQNSKSSGSSRVSTIFLLMELDHSSGQLKGSVRDGPHQGRSLDDLSLPELLELYNFYHLEDEESARLLQAFIQQRHGDRRGPTRSSFEMDRSEAFRTLGLEETANEEEIVARHRSLMQKLHPDRGGSAELAARINRAKEILIGKKSRT